MLRFFYWLGRRLAVIALAVSGAAIALVVYSSIGQAGIATGDNVGHYTYPSSDCHEADADAGDPINVVFYQGATKQDLDYYFDLYHGWGDNGGGTHYFKTYGNCYEMDGQPSSNRWGLSRYHARYHRGLNSSGAVDMDSAKGDYSIAAAHYENKASGGDCGPVGDVVPVDGFNLGRDNVVINWVMEGGHYYAGYENWHNTAFRLQCDGETLAWSDGKVKFIRAATGSVEGMSLSPKRANLWVCYNSTSHTCNPLLGEGARFVAEEFSNPSGIGAGSYYFFAQALAPKDVDLDAIDGGFLDKYGREVSCTRNWYNSAHSALGLTCSSTGSERGPLGDAPSSGDPDPLAWLIASVDPATLYMGNPAIRGTRNNGFIVALKNNSCQAAGVDGVPLPGSDGTQAPVCSSGSLTVRTLEGDLDLDCDVDVVDEQGIAFRYGADAWCCQLYDEWYDLEPKYLDYDIDIKDLQLVFGRDGSTCQNPIPYDQAYP